MAPTVASLALVVRENTAEIHSGKKIILKMEVETAELIRGVAAVKTEVTEVSRRLNAIEVSNASHAAVMANLGESIDLMRGDMRRSQAAAKTDLNSITTRILDDAKAAREHQSMVTMRGLGILSIIVTAITGLATWYITGQMPTPTPTQPEPFTIEAPAEPYPMSAQPN